MQNGVLFQPQYILLRLFVNSALAAFSGFFRISFFSHRTLLSLHPLRMSGYVKIGNREVMANLKVTNFKKFKTKNFLSLSNASISNFENNKIPKTKLKQ